LLNSRNVIILFVLVSNESTNDYITLALLKYCHYLHIWVKSDKCGKYQQQPCVSTCEWICGS